MHINDEEKTFLREKKKQDPNAPLYRIAALGVLTVSVGLLIFLVGSLAKSKQKTEESDIKIMEAPNGAATEMGEYAFSVSAAAVPAEKAEAPAIEVEPITREKEEKESAAKAKNDVSATSKPQKTSKPEKNSSDEEPEPQEEIAYSSRSILSEDGEEDQRAEAEPTETPVLKPTETPEPTAQPTPSFTTLSKHDSSPEVTQLQKRLMELGYLDIDEPTDYFGTVTENAVRLFQRQHGLTVDGSAGQETQTRLYAGDAQKYCLTIGAEGGDVRMLQQQLCELGYLEKNEIDSIYGESTVYAVKSFQERNKLTSDGLAGAKTLEILYSDEARISYAAYKKQQEAEAEKKKKAATPKPTATPQKEKFISAAYAKLGCEYVLGDRGPNTFDCSGFVYWCLREAGVSVTRLNAAGFSNKSSWKKITKLSDLEEGDILFYRSETSSHVNHCGIYIGGGKMIDASSGNGKVVKRSLSSYWKENFVCARRPW